MQEKTSELEEEKGVGVLRVFDAEPSPHPTTCMNRFDPRVLKHCKLTKASVNFATVELLWTAIFFKFHSLVRSVSSLTSYM